jgi:hypothetical protein
MTILRSCSDHLRRGLAAVIMSASIAGTANADTFNIGTLGNEPYINSVLHDAGSFLDVYNFTVTKLTNLVLGAVTNEVASPTFGSILSIDGLKVGLFNATTPGALAFPLSAGNYFVEVSGKADGRNGGAYLFSMAAPIAPVPEPGIWLSLLAGGAFLSRVARRART